MSQVNSPEAIAVFVMLPVFTIAAMIYVGDAIANRRARLRERLRQTRQRRQLNRGD